MKMESGKLYHMVPKKMEGDTLFPLNQLPENLGEIGRIIYQEEIKKYDNTSGRQNLTQQVISNIDNSKWNDVIHLTPVHPKIIRDAIKETLKKINKGKDLPHWDYFEIDPYLLNKKNTIIYLNKDKPILEKLSSKDFIDFNPLNIHEYSSLPNETLLHYEDSILNNNKMPFLHHAIPHVLTKDPIDITKAKKINTSDFEE